jgi:hypothetical protein
MPVCILSSFACTGMAAAITKAMITGNMTDIFFIIITSPFLDYLKIALTGIM